MRDVFEIINDVGSQMEIYASLLFLPAGNFFKKNIFWGIDFFLNSLHEYLLNRTAKDVTGLLGEDKLTLQIVIPKMNVCLSHF